MPNQSLTQELFNQLQGAPMQQIAQQLGTSTDQASSAVSQALPLLMGALGNQAQNGQGGSAADALLGALGGLGGTQAHALAGQGGGLGDVLGGLAGNLLGGAASSSGASGGGLGGMLGGLVGSVLGGTGTQTQAQNTQASASQDAGGPGGAAAGNAGDLLSSVFGSQATARATEGLGQSTGLGSQGASKLVTLLLPVVLSFLAGRYLGRNGGGKEQMNEALANEQQQINAQTGGGLSGLLDQNGDGKLDMHDIVKLGSSLFGGR